MCNKLIEITCLQLPFPRGYVKISDLQITASSVFILSWDKLELRFPTSQKYRKLITRKNKHCF